MTRVGTPMIVNVTGGLQDQCGFELNGTMLVMKIIERYIHFTIGTNGNIIAI